MKLPASLEGLIAWALLLVAAVQGQSNSTEACVSPYKRISFDSQTRIMSLKDFMGMDQKYYCDQALNWNVHVNNSLQEARHTEGRRG